MLPIGSGPDGDWIAAITLALATLVSEDLACATAGAIVAEGRISLSAAMLGCLAGIVAGDLLLFWAGRLMGRRVLQWPILERHVPAGAFERSAEWIDRRGAIVVLLSRFTPGTRLPTCLVAGALRTNPWRFTLWFALSAALWTPLIVGASAAAGREFRWQSTIAERGVAMTMLLTVLLVAGALRIGSVLGNWRARRRLAGRWRRLTRWEFWPIWVLYPPVVAYILYLLTRFHGVPVFTAANPGIPGGGFVGESKFDILRNLASSGGFIARSALLAGGMPPERRVQVAHRWIEQLSLEFPVVVKPDKGQRGAGVTIVRTPDALERVIRTSDADLILQEFAPGLEFGVFYARHPATARGRIVSITEKRFPHVVGDGRRTLEELILADERAVCLDRLHCRVHGERLRAVPRAGERIQLVEVGSHCRGALFLDATHLLTPQMEDAFDAIAKRFPGFCFGRFDVRTPSVLDLRLGRNFKVVELNGVTSESTHIYDPGNGLLTAYRVLFAQWRLAFEIGAANVARGAVPTSFPDLLAMVLQASKGVTSGLPRTSNAEWEYDYDDSRPHTARGCPAQAWSVAEILRLEHSVLTPRCCRKADARRERDFAASV